MPTVSSDPDLFWALRGGGGSFGVVTAIEIELFAIETVYAGVMFWPQERAREVLMAWAEWTEWPLPDEIVSVGRILNPRRSPRFPSRCAASGSSSWRRSTSARRTRVPS